MFLLVYTIGECLPHQGPPPTKLATFVSKYLWTQKNAIILDCITLPGLFALMTYKIFTSGITGC